MHVTLIPLGTRGDVQPHIALGLGLRRAGHHVRIATHASFAPFVRSFDLEHFTVGGDPDQVILEFGPQMSDENPLKSVSAIMHVLSELITGPLRGVTAACRDTDVVVASYPALYAALDSAEKYGVPICLASLHPSTPTAFAGSMLMPQLPQFLPPRLRRAYNRLSHLAADALIFRMVRRSVNVARAQQLQLGPLLRSPVRILHERRLPILYSYSATLLPRPPDWPSFVEITGFWTLAAEPAWQPPQPLLDFLAAGPPPLYVGFGSVGPLAQRAMRCVIEALSRRQQRALIMIPDALAPALPSSPHLLRIGSTPHAWLLPRTAGAIHHGGVGTTAAALEAGVPMAVVAFSVEQSFWGRAANQLGVAPPPQTAKALTPHRADQLITALTRDLTLRAAAEKVGTTVRAERGVERAIPLIERLAHR